jgi:hypothetical protein
MVFSWEFGWLNSFNKGYEERLIGPVTGHSGIVLFCLAMLYVPMAQAHQAATGDHRAFFDCGFVFRLIHARMGSYVGLAALMTAVSFPLEVLKSLPVIFDQGCPILIQDLLERFEATRALPEVIKNLYPGLGGYSEVELRWGLEIYLLRCSLVFFVSLLLVRLVAARVYRSAVLRALRLGSVERRDLHPVLAGWLDRLELMPQPRPARRGFSRVIRGMGTLAARIGLYVVLFGLWFVFVAKVYVGEFICYHPVLGFLNHPLVQLPCFDYFPLHLLHLPAR